MKKLIISFILLIGIAGNVLGGTYAGGSGIEGDPYLISDANDMQEIGANVGDWGSHFLLTNDIDLGQFTGTEFNIIGNNTNTFTGVFDGDEHSISNFAYSSTGTNYIGLFGYVDDVNAEINDLILKDPNLNITNSGYIGALAGGFMNGIITNCAVEGGSISGGGKVGGLVGHNDDATISECHATCEVSGGSDIGGLLGHTRDSIISNCYASGDVSGYTYTGGLAGHHEYIDWTPPTTSIISNCYANGSVSGSGGSFIGGLVGRIYRAYVLNCYATGTVSASVDSTGGLAGTQYAGAVWNSYWDIQTSGLVDGIGTDGGFATIEAYV